MYVAAVALQLGLLAALSRWRSGSWRVAALLSLGAFCEGFLRIGGTSGGWQGWGTWTPLEDASNQARLAIAYLTYGGVWLAAAFTVTNVRFAWLLVSCSAVGTLLSGYLSAEPPWYAEGATRALTSVAFGATVAAADVAPMAAFPSMHVAIPWVMWRGGRYRGWLAYAVFQAVVVVLGGEHYATDVIGGVLLVEGVIYAGRGILWSSGFGQDGGGGVGALQRPQALAGYADYDEPRTARPPG